MSPGAEGPAAFDAHLRACLAELDRESGLSRASPALFEALGRFLRSGGKRLRPRLLLMAYEGYSSRPNPEIWKVAVALELFHNFALIHDDIVDDSPTRRGGPSMHALLAAPAALPPGAAGGKELAMLAGDVLYSLAVRALLSFGPGSPAREAALREFMTTAIRTGAGAFAELSARELPLGRITRGQILTIYDLKTSLYTFVCPLRVGAILAGASAAETERLAEYGRLLGRAFQMRDDLEDLAGFLAADPGTGRLGLAETKIMLPLWLAAREAGQAERAWLEDLYARDAAGREDRERLRELLDRSFAVERTLEEIGRLLARAERVCASLAMSPPARQALQAYARRLVQPEPAAAEARA